MHFTILGQIVTRSYDYGGISTGVLQDVGNGRVFSQMGMDECDGMDALSQRIGLYMDYTKKLFQQR